MAARKTRFVGWAYSTTGKPVSVSCYFNGLHVFNNTIETTTYVESESDVPTNTNTINEEEQVLFEFDTHMTTVGDIPLQFTVSGGTVFFAGLRMNYTWEQNCDYFMDPNTNTPESDGIEDVEIDGQIVMDRVAIGDLLGDWHYRVNDKSTFSCYFVVEEPIGID